MAAGQHIITCASDALGAVRDALEKKFGAPESAKLTWQPKNGVTVNEEQAKALLKLIEMLEDNDDVQEVFSNFEISETVMQKLSA
jgi:transcriptional/translational regulatory protein YebC/TACO1